MNTQLYKTPCHLCEAVRERSVALLNKQLADAIDLQMQAKQAQWDIIDPHFLSLHLLCDQISREVGHVTDTIADRIARLGGKAAGTMLAIASMSRLPSYPERVASAREQLTALSNSLAAFAAFVDVAAETAGNDDDLDTVDVLAEASRRVDNLLRIIKSYCGKRPSFAAPSGGRIVNVPKEKADGEPFAHAAGY
jgi:starvation-inducible DNA-binding protein